MSIQAAGFHSAMQSGREALQNNDLTAVVHAYNLAISFARGPASDAEAYTRRAAAYYKMGEFDCAITDCSAAIKRKPDYPTPISIVGGLTNKYTRLSMPLQIMTVQRTRSPKSGCALREEAQRRLEN